MNEVYVDSLQRPSDVELSPPSISITIVIGIAVATPQNGGEQNMSDYSIISGLRFERLGQDGEIRSLAGPNTRSGGGGWGKIVSIIDVCLHTSSGKKPRHHQ